MKDALVDYYLEHSPLVRNDIHCDAPLNEEVGECGGRRWVSAESLRGIVRDDVLDRIAAEASK